MEKKQLKISLYPGSWRTARLFESTDWSPLRKAVVRNPQQFVMNKNKTENLRFIKDQAGTVTSVDLTVGSWIASDLMDPDVVVLPEFAAPVRYISFALSKDFNLLPRKVLRNMGYMSNFGIVHKLMRKYRMVYNIEQSEVTVSVNLSLSEVQSCFWLLIAGVLISVFYLLAELHVGKTCRHRSSIVVNRR